MCVDASAMRRLQPIRGQMGGGSQELGANNCSAQGGRSKGEARNPA